MINSGGCAFVSAAAHARPTVAWLASKLCRASSGSRNNRLAGTIRAINPAIRTKTGSRFSRGEKVPRCSGCETLRGPDPCGADPAAEDDVMRAIEIRRFANDTMLGFQSAPDFRKADCPSFDFVFLRVLCGC